MISKGAAVRTTRISIPEEEAGYEIFKLESCGRPADLRYAGHILLTSATRTRTRIHAPIIPGYHVTPSPAEPAETASAPSQLRYIAVPPGQHVAGMAHARIVVKRKKATRHGSRHTQKKAASPAAAVKTPTETAEPVAKR